MTTANLKDLRKLEYQTNQSIVNIFGSLMLYLFKYKEDNILKLYILNNYGSAILANKMHINALL